MKRTLALTTIGLGALFALALLLPQTGQALIGSSPLKPVGLFCVPKKPGADLAFARAQCDDLVSKGADAELIGNSPLAFLKPCMNKTDSDFFGAWPSEPGICEDLLGAVYGGFDPGFELPAIQSPQCLAADGVPELEADFKLWLCMSADANGE